MADKLVDMDAKIQIYPSVMLAMLDTDISKHMMKLLSYFLNTKIPKRRMKNDKNDKTSSDKLA